MSAWRCARRRNRRFSLPRRGVRCRFEWFAKAPARRRPVAIIRGADKRHLGRAIEQREQFCPLTREPVVQYLLLVRGRDARILDVIYGAFR